jgi:ATP-dependent RNA helicase DDX49/DBP8
MKKQQNVLNKTTFEDLGLHQWLIKACSEMGFQHPTAVQESCIPQILNGKDCIGAAETGSGKTAAFALPILHHLSNEPCGFFALILTPSRFGITYSR